MAGSEPPRTVLHGDGVAWLRQTELCRDQSIVTSLPDHSELPELGFDGWRRWFVDVVALICERLDDSAVAVFYQTDVKHDGRWVDKGHLVLQGANRAGSHLLSHKIACRVPPGTTTFGRPAFGHILCLSRQRRFEPGQSTPDVIASLGEMTWPRAIGSEVCDAIVEVLIRHTDTRVVVDPFCGLGSILVAASRRGLGVIGVEASRKRAKKARLLLDPTC